MWVWGAITAAASIYGAIKGSQAASKAGEARADANRRNAEYLREQAEFARQLGAQRQRQYEDQATRFRSQQTGMFAKAGVDLAGSAMQAVGETSARMEQQLAQIKWTTDNEVRFGNLKAENYELAARDTLAAIPYQQAAIWGQAAPVIIGGMSKVPWSKFGSSVSTLGASAWDSMTIRPSFNRIGIGYRG